MRLEQACARAQAFGSSDYSSVKRILAAGLEQPERTGVTQEAAESASAAGRPYTFMRQASEFVLSLLAGHHQRSRTGADGARRSGRPQMSVSHSWRRPSSSCASRHPGDA